MIHHYNATFSSISGTVDSRQPRKGAGAFIELISRLRIKWSLLIPKRCSSLHDNGVRPAFCGFHASLGLRLIRESRSPRTIKRPYNHGKNIAVTIHRDTRLLYGVSAR